MQDSLPPLERMAALRTSRIAPLESVENWWVGMSALNNKKNIQLSAAGSTLLWSKSGEQVGLVSSLPKIYNTFLELLRIASGV